MVLESCLSSEVAVTYRTPLVLVKKEEALGKGSSINGEEDLRRHGMVWEGKRSRLNQTSCSEDRSRRGGLEVIR